MHTCTRPPCKPLSARGGSYKTHIANANKHKTCNASCPGFAMLPPKIPEEKRPHLRILFVLPHSYKRPLASDGTPHHSYNPIVMANKEDLQWLKEVKKLVPGLDQAMVHFQARKMLYIYSWVSRSQHSQIRNETDHLICSDSPVTGVHSALDSQHT